VEKLLASGEFHVLCYDKDGNLKWEEKNHNRVVNAGLQYMAGTALTGGTQSTTWFIGLVTGPGSSVTYSANDIMSSHAGWTEFTGYSQATRRPATFTSATTANPSVVTNSTSAAAFTISTSGNVAGAFLTNVNTKGGTAGTLFSASNFTGGNRVVTLNDTVTVVYTFSLTAA
jgi:hypothetical protein